MNACDGGIWRVKYTQYGRISTLHAEGDKSQTTVSDWLVVLVMLASCHSVFGGQCCLPCCCVGQSSSTCCCVGQSSSTYCCVRQSCLMCYCFSAGQLFLTCHAGSRTFVPTSNVGVWCILWWRAICTPWWTFLLQVVSEVSRWQSLLVISPEDS